MAASDRFDVFNSLKNQCYNHIETSQIIWRANQLTAFYMMGKLAVKGLNNQLKFNYSFTVQLKV